MDILQLKKRDIEGQYDSIMSQIINQKRGLSSQTNIPNHLLIESRKAFKQHENSNSKNKFLGRMKIYTPQGAKILRCKCEKSGLSVCDSATQTPSQKRSAKLDDQLLRFEKTLKSVRSEKCFYRMARNAEDQTCASSINNQTQTGKKRQYEFPDYQTGSFKITKAMIDSPTDEENHYGFTGRFRNFQRQKTESKPLVPDEPIFLRPRITPNECSFCLKKCDSFICETCQRFTRKR